MTVYISPNPGKEQAADTARRAAQLLLMQGAVVLMRDDLKESCYAEGVQYLPLEECLPRTDVILTIGGDGTILHEANFTLQYQNPSSALTSDAAASSPPVRWMKWKKTRRSGAGRIYAGQPDAALVCGCWARMAGKGHALNDGGRDERPSAAGHRLQHLLRRHPCRALPW
mgnify:CR=1 FL=1